MNLSLGFPDFPTPQELAPRADVQTSITRFQDWMAAPDSPIRAIRVLPAREPQWASIPGDVHTELRAALQKRGIERLYSHQAEAFAHIAAGRNAVIVTPTASGKTLCYTLPVLNRLLVDPETRALFLFPTKALSEDQLQDFQATVDTTGAGIRAFTYDGDTPQDARKAIRERANVVFTNPDMLHTGILPHHTKWAKLFENLQYFVLDELHYYRGVYGSHLGNIIRRLKRICQFYGSDPQFICSSATIANPLPLAERIFESSFAKVDRNGAPCGEKFVVFYNPPVVNRQLGIRRSYLHEARRVALELLDQQQQTLVFANNRLATEILVKYLKEAFERKPAGPDVIRGYRGGYLPRERREIEAKLRSGEIRAVVATNALELGIDIGSLDAVVMAGYPGTIASTWQRAGRAGRRQNTSLAVLVASSAPLDQYIIEHPDYFFNQPPEHAAVNPDNLEILLNHLKCAAFELPIRAGETFGPHTLTELCGFLEEGGYLHASGGAWHWTSDTYPADAVSLRSVTSDNFVVIDITSSPKVIAEVSFPVALTELHEKAIYLHEARQFQVEKFDYDGRKAYVRRVECDYFTDAIDYTQVKAIDVFARDPLGAAYQYHGEVRLNRQIVGFKKLKFYTMENVGAGNLSLPEQEMHTTAFWLHFPAALLDRLTGCSPTEIQNAVVALGQALRTVGALLLMCDPRDLGSAVGEHDEGGIRMFEPVLYLYDNFAGGIGLSAPLFRNAARLLSEARQLIAGCSCESGCPSCVGPLGEVGERGKDLAIRLIDEIGTAATAG